jgi:ribonuclease D
MIMKIYKPDISKEELAGYDVIAFDGKIVCVDNISVFREAMDFLWNASHTGFDTETKPAFKKGQKHRVSLLQISANGHAFLFRLNKIGFPEDLARFLSTDDIPKIGVAIHDDIKSLKELRNFEPGGFIELQDMVKDYGIASAGLKKLSAIVLGYRISKSQQVSNWENESLTYAQQLYAATDAWVCARIFDELLKNGTKTEK